MSFTLQFGEAGNKQNNKIKQDIQSIDVAMASRKVKQTTQIRQSKRMAREGLIFE